MVGTIEATMSDSSTCSGSKDGEILNSDVLYPCDEEQIPDRTQMSFSYRTFSESSGENNATQVREAHMPYNSEDTQANTHIMSGSTHNFLEDGHMDNFEGRAEPFFPKWRLPSKIRRKFTTGNKDHDCSMQEASEIVENVNDIGDHVVIHSPKNNLRVCVDCNTTKTPLWRGGPQGPKSLCNACGIRYRKKRRALFASLNPDKAQSVPPKKRINLLHTAKKQNKSSKSSSSVGTGSNHLPLQVNRFFAFYQRHGFEKGMYGNSSSSMPHTASPSAFHRRFAQEEEEAAKLLMAISYGLVYA